jgi:hypothetical protein
MSPSPFVALMRRYCNDYTNCHNFSVCDTIMVPDYTLHMGVHHLRGRDEAYKPATRRQFEQFPGLALVVNQIITNGERLAMRFTEHGASVRHGGAKSAWAGIGLYKWNGDQLLENYVEQDYYSRRQQLVSGVPNCIETPALAPWDTVAMPADAIPEEVVRAVIAAGTLIDHPAILFDDEPSGARRQRVLRPYSTRVNDLFSAGSEVAFHIEQTGTTTTDFAEIDKQEVLHMAGIVRVHDGAIVEGRVIRDRIGLAKRVNC